VSKKRICIIAFKPVRTTIHVLRQIDYLSPHYDLTVIGHGDPDAGWPPLTWHAVPAQTLVGKVAKGLWYVLGRVFPLFYDAWFWTSERHKLAYKYAVSSGADAIHANDWQSLPIAVAVARRTKGRVVLHLHEYAEEEGASALWRLLVAPAIRHLIKTYISESGVPIDASITVCEPIAERYRRELGLDPIVVRNAPKQVEVPPREGRADAKHIRLIHHGYAKRGRGLHNLIEALALTDQRFTLDFMLVDDDHGYVDDLRKLADRLVPGRVRFRQPVPPGEIVRYVSEYDMGFCVIEPSSYNNLMMLPNKLFEYIQAGLAVCVGPSPAMAQLVKQYGVGRVAASFKPADVADTLNQLTLEELNSMKEAAHRAAAVLNSDVEMGKVVAVYRKLLDGEDLVAQARVEEAGAGGP